MSFPSQIQAVGIHKTGDFDVIEDLKLPFPKNAQGNVLVKVCFVCMLYEAEADLDRCERV